MITEQNNFTFFNKNVFQRMDGDMLNVKIVKGKYLVVTLRDKKGVMKEAYGKNFMTEEVEGGKKNV